MAITYEQLMHPKGRIRPDLFPHRKGAQLQEDVQAWVVDGQAQPRVVALADEDARDRAVVAYAYWRAFDAALIDMAANPSTSSQADAGSASYTKDQRDIIARFAAEAKAEYEALAPLQAAVYLGGGTRTVYHTFS